MITGILLYPLLKAATGYSAKMLCSGIFVEGLSQNHVEQMELSYFPFHYINNKVDKKAKRVKSTIAGLVSQTAVYENQIGATLYPKGYKTIEDRIIHPTIPSDNLPWPIGNVLTDTVPSGIDINGLRAYIDHQFNKESRAVVVIKDGQLIAEKYATDIHMNTPLLGWSMTKSITSTLAGILVQAGKLDINQKVTIDKWQNDKRKNITLNNLLQMSSGLQWNEDYSKSSLSDVSKMLYLKNDMYGYAVNSKFHVAPDSIWNYSSGTSNIISGVMKQCFDDYTTYYQFPQKALFNKLGMSHSLIETDAQGTFVGSSFGYCSARDWARLGLLYLNNGQWLGEQILPQWWVKYSTTPVRQSNGQYGVHMWLNASQIHMPDMPPDVYFFNGYRGQRVTIIPSKNMVVACLNSSDKKVDFNGYLSEMMSFIK